MIAKGWLLHIVLVVLFSSKISSLDCNQFRSWLQEANRANLELLKSKMGTPIPVQCIEDVMNFSTNQEFFRNINDVQREHAKVAIQEIFQQILHVFKQNDTEMSWDDNSKMVFQTMLDQQIRTLETCWSVEMESGATSPRGQKTQLTRLRVKRYFRTINNFLKDKEYSLCAWKNVHIQVKQCLLLTDDLIKSIPNEA